MRSGFKTGAGVVLVLAIVVGEPVPVGVVVLGVEDVVAGVGGCVAVVVDPGVRDVGTAVAEGAEELVATGFVEVTLEVNPWSWSLFPPLVRKITATIIAITIAEAIVMSRGLPDLGFITAFLGFAESGPRPATVRLMATLISSLSNRASVECGYFTM